MITTLDLFAGAGGLSLGFAQAGLGFEPLAAVEHDEAASLTYKKHFGCLVLDQRIEDVTDFPCADVVIGGPPVQGFSSLGRGSSDVGRDQLNQPWQRFLDALRQVRPLAFVIDYPPGVERTSQYQQLLLSLRDDLDLRKYSYSHGVLNAVDYGVPQNRRRLILLGIR